MKTTVSRSTANLTGAGGRGTRRLFQELADRFSSCATATAGLVIKVFGSTLAKTGSAAFHGTANGKAVTIAGSTDMPALTGCNFDAGYYNVACFFIDEASTVTMIPGTQAATLAGVKFPEFPAKQCLVGYLVITYASAFTGGTTALDTATTQYVSPVGAFDPNLTLT